MPSHFSVISEFAVAKSRADDLRQSEEVSAKKAEVMKSEMGWFKTALKSDQCKLSTLQKASGSIWRHMAPFVVIPLS